MGRRRQCLRLPGEIFRIGSKAQNANALFDQSPQCGGVQSQKTDVLVYAQ